MFAIRIKDTYLDLDPRAAISIRMNNPIFDADNFPRTWTLPFSLPLTPRNLAVLGYPNLINFSGKKKIENTVLYIEGLPFETGTFTIKKSSDQYISAVFQNVDLSVLDQLEKINIHEILETVPIPQTNVAQTILTIDSPPGDYSLNVNNMNYQLDASDILIYPDAISVAGQLELLINADFPNWAAANTPNELIISPPVGENLSLQVFEGVNVQTNTPPAAANQANMKDYVEDSVVNGNNKISFATIFNPAFYENANANFEGYINYVEDGVMKENEPELSRQFVHTLIPFVRLSYIFERIVANSDIKAIAGDFFELADTQQLIIYNNYALDQISEYIDVVTASTRYLNGFKAEIDINQHVPELTAKEALNLLGFANVYYEFKGETIYIRKKIGQLLQPATDWTKKAEPSINQDFAEEEGFSLRYPTDDTDTAKRSGQLTELKIGDGGDPLILPIGTLYEDTRSVFLDPDAFTWAIPYIEQKGSSDELNIGKNETGVKLLFDRGNRQNSRDNNYPYATHKDVDYKAQSVGTYTLDWSGATGIYETFWKQYLPLLQGDTVSKNIRLNIQDILDIRKWENSRRTIRHPNGHLSGVIKTISFKIDQTGISPAIVEFIKE
jgi:hypothetical protein